MSLQYQIEVRVYRYLDTHDEYGRPDELSLYQKEKTLDPLYNSVFDYMDDFKQQVSEVVLEDMGEIVNEEAEAEINNGN